MLTSMVVAIFLALFGTCATRLSVWRFRRTGAAFRCRLRVCSLTSARWPRSSRWWSRPMWAAWHDDVLVVRRGPVLARTIRLRATLTPAGVYAVPADDATRCGKRPIAAGLRVSDGSQLEVAAAAEAREALVGPYLAAAINGLPRAPVPRRRPDARA
ncbi:MAG TPA: hypothetical protein VKB14_12420 [Actinomycetales bacterium]|nr:hypothetical protein [Actinomycetales bacterium]